MKVGWKQVLGGESVDGGRGNDNINWFTCILCSVVRGFFPCTAELIDRFGGAVAFPVTADEESTSHFG